MSPDTLVTAENIGTIRLLLSCAAAGFCLVLALFVLLRDSRSFVNRVFALGMAGLAAEEILAFLASGLLSPEALIFRERLLWTAAAVVPGFWLLFSFSFARQNYRHILTRWRWPLVLAFILPLGLAIWGNGRFFRTAVFVRESGSWLLPLGWVGIAFFVLCLLCYVAILVNLEAILLTSTGRQRWQVKYLLFGAGSVFAVRIYTTSQTLVYATLDTQLSILTSFALVAACLLLTVGLVRSQLVYPDIYFSRRFLSGSITLSIVGVYLVAVALMAHGFRSWELFRNLPLNAFVVFVALCVLAILLRSDHARRRIDRFITLHLRRPRYDYRQVWTEFTRRTPSLIDEGEIARATSRLLSETLSMLSVSLWLIKEKQDGLVLAGSTALCAGSERSEVTSRLLDRLADVMRDRSEPIDLQSTPDLGDKKFVTESSALLDKHHIRVCARLAACQEFIGVITLGDRVGDDTVTVEDLQLIQTIADQAASLLLNQRTAERLRKTREQEAYQNLAAFLVHDLKNVASGLSLTVQNLPKHFDNPDFREHAIKIIRQSVDRMNQLSQRLSAVRREAELNPQATDLNQLVQQTVAESEIAYHSRIVQQLQPLPVVCVDAEQIQKVLANLLANANQATNDGGEIVVATEVSGDRVQILVSDNGCGMSGDFIRHSLFRAFQTTKKDGMGIGLFQSKMIVEAHGGQIGVESAENRGTTFRVTLPLGLAPRMPAVASHSNP